jgi:hypothetical protein
LNGKLVLAGHFCCRMTGFHFGFMLPVLGLFVVHLWGLWNFLSLISQICRLPSISSVWVAKVGILFLLVQVLLDFVCRINDDHGPMEEQRQRYGPPLYELTSFSIALRVFVSLWWSSFDHPISYVTLSLLL